MVLEQIWLDAGSFIDDFISASDSKVFSPKFCFVVPCWKPPYGLNFKLNMDASCDDVKVAKARAILIGIQLAYERGLLPLLVESDVLNVTRLCNGELLSRSDVENIVFDIQVLLKSCNIHSVSFISRLGNCVAHGITKRAFNLVVPCLWTCYFHVWLVKLLYVNVALFFFP
ncbi:hypothetical protein ACOSQ3_013570 [Xanthoceras sorbifolium]